MKIFKRIFMLGSVIMTALVVLLGISGSADAFWHTSYNETFEVGEPFEPSPFPWPTGEIEGLMTGWSRIPEPPGPGPWHTWDKEDSLVYRYHGIGSYRALWCAGAPDDYECGVDTYPNGMNAWAIWGPYMVTEEMVEAGGVFYFWGNLELYQEGAGDNFAFVVTDNTDNLGSYEDCCLAYQFLQGTTGFEWWNAEWDFADLDSLVDPDEFEYDSVSYMPFYDDDMVLHERDEIYIALVFQSNWTMRGGPPPDPIDYGIVVDDFSVGYDDGEFDFEAMGIDLMEAEDTLNQYNQIHVNDPIRFRTMFRSRGPQPEETVNHILYLDTDLTDEVGVWELPLDTMSGIWESSRYGLIHSEMFGITYVPQDTGNIEIGVCLDADSLVTEWSDSNNYVSEVVYVNQEQTPPYMIWISLVDESITITEESQEIELFYEAYNSPDDEEAYITFYYDDSQPPDTTGPIIPGTYYTPIINGEDSFTWDLSEMENGEYYLYAMVIDDFFYMPGYVYAPYPVIINIADNVNESDDPSVPTEFAIAGVYPNPFNPTVEVKIDVPRAGDITANWFALNGRLVDSNTIQNAQPGVQIMTWTPSNLASGMYLLRLSSNMGHASTKVIYLK